MLPQVRERLANAAEGLGHRLPRDRHSDDPTLPGHRRDGRDGEAEQRRTGEHRADHDEQRL